MGQYQRQKGASGKKEGGGRKVSYSKKRNFIFSYGLSKVKTLSYMICKGGLIANEILRIGGGGGGSKVLVTERNTQLKKQGESQRKDHFSNNGIISEKHLMQREEMKPNANPTANGNGMESL